MVWVYTAIRNNKKEHFRFVLKMCEYIVITAYYYMQLSLYQSLIHLQTQTICVNILNSPIPQFSSLENGGQLQIYPPRIDSQEMPAEHGLGVQLSLPVTDTPGKQNI